MMPRVQLPATTPKRRAWNKGRIIGQKRPLLPKQVWAIRARLELAGNLRDLALFNVAIDSKLRGCDLVKLAVNDLITDYRVREPVSVVQSKTKRPVQFELTENTRDTVLAWVKSPAIAGLQVYVPKSLPCSHTHLDTSVWSHCSQVGDGDRTRAERIRHAFVAQDKSRGKIPQNRKSARCAVVAGPH